MRSNSQDSAPLVPLMSDAQAGPGADGHAAGLDRADGARQRELDLRRRPVLVLDVDQVVRLDAAEVRPLAHRLARAAGDDRGRAAAEALDRPGQEVREVDDVGHQVAERAEPASARKNRQEAAESGRFA
jgi:hypothetical protein